MLEQRLEAEIKTALLARDSQTATTLRTLKAALLSYKVAEGKRDSGITDDEVIAIFSKEAKKRQESADLFRQGGNNEKAEDELAEKAIIETYLPAQLSEEEIGKTVDEVIAATGANSAQDMGMVIGQVRGKLGAAADGSVIARLVKGKLGV